MSADCSAQQSNWTFTGFGPHFRNHNAVQILNSGRIVAAGGNLFNDALTSFFVSNDSAVSWGITVDSINAMMNDMHFPDDNDGYAVGNAGNIFKTTDQGMTWLPQSLTSPANARDYFGVHFINSSTGIAVGGAGNMQTILRTTDGGVNWNIISDVSGPVLKDVMFVNGTIGYAVGDSGVAIKTIDGGISWSALTLPIGLNIRNFNSVCFVDAMTGFIAGGNPTSAHQNFLKTIDGGLNWTVINDQNGSMYNVVYFYTDSLGYVAGENGLLKYTSDQGTTWSTFVISGNDVNQINDINFLNRSFGIASGDYGKTLVYHDSLIHPPIAAIVPVATIINANTVQVDGTVSAYNLNTTVEFEYGLTPSFGNLIAMTPSLTLNNNVPVSVLVPGLTLSTVYYGRIKVSNALGVGYSNTIQFYTDTSSGANFSFENWNDYSAEFPFEWYNAGGIQKVLSYDGSFATQIQALNQNSPGALFYAIDTQHGPPFPGKPFSGGRPDSLIYHLRYDIETGDTAIVWLYFTSNGNTISDTMVKITGSSGGLFQQLAIPIHYSSSAVPDSIGVFFVSTNFFSGNISTVSVITVDNLLLTNSTAQLPNSDMETWTVVTRNHAVSWYSQDDNNFHPADSAFVRRSTNAFVGNYAMQLQSFSYKNYGAFLKSGPNLNSQGPDFPVYIRHTSFNGMYQLHSTSNDTFSVNITMYYQGTQIGSAYQSYGNTSSNYLLFSIPINYYTSDIPDSASIQFILGKRDTLLPIGDSYVLIDALGFDAIMTNVLSQEGNVNFEIYPNPATNNLNIHIPESSKSFSDKCEISIFDISGRLCLKTTAELIENIQIDVSALPSATYFIEVKTENQTLHNKFIIKK